MANGLISRGSAARLIAAAAHCVIHAATGRKDAFIAFDKETWLMAGSSAKRYPSRLVKEHRTVVYWDYIGIMEKTMETTIVYWSYIGIMDKKLETTIVYWSYIGIMAKNMENAIVYWSYIGDNGKENGSYCCVSGLYRDDGKENGNYYRV